MTYLSAFKSGNLIIPSALLFHFKEIFDSSDDFLVWQFFYLQNTTSLEEVAPRQIAENIGKTLTEVNRSMSHLTEKGLLQYKTIELNGETEVIFDASPALEKLDEILSAKTGDQQPVKTAQNILKDLVDTFQQELGRLLTPFEIEDLTKTIQDDQTNPDLVKAALREAVFNGKANWKYIQAILRNWRREGITSLAQVEAKRAEREATSPQNITVSDDFLSAMNLWKD
ncbi:DnaD domain-containing protein [Streptococcus sinensis]|uniref:Chromosome replication initiation protein dnaD n=1 Tax=Streptococcus sinensis TaxID=176090 RepID=A0A0A0DKY8_9STRE|nr:DnaD domain-containing protein [Streptococcus sinensis]KGM37642.1 Chromosome replication initiation protein dnaD [Streptococcus sinensis]